MICFCLNNLRSESWMDAEYGNWSFEGMTSVEMLRDREFLRTGRITFWEIVHTVVFEYICRIVVWLRQQALRWEAAGHRLQLKERRTWTGWKNLLWRWRRQDFDNFSGQAKYVFILRIVQTVVLKNCRTCAAIACYVQKLDHWLQEGRRFLIMRS